MERYIKLPTSNDTLFINPMPYKNKVFMANVQKENLMVSEKTIIDVQEKIFKLV